MKLKVWAFGLALGIVWGLSLFVLTLIGINTTYADAFLGVIDSIYPWYSWTVAGAFVGLGLGFIDGFLCGVIVAWIYNRFAK